MKWIPVKTPGLLKILYKKYTWSFNSHPSKKRIFLTFDDGPIPEITPFILQILSEFKAKATFFCVGENAKKYPEILKQIEKEGHGIGNHTMNHLKAWKSSDQEYLQSVQQCQNQLTAVVSTPVKLFRPPYGQLSRSKLNKIQKLGYQIILWDVLPKDWDSEISSDKCFNNILKNSVNGSIIVLHDNIKSFDHVKYILPKLLEYYTNKGFTFEIIS